MLIIMCIYSGKKVLICCKYIYSYDAFLLLKIVKIGFSFGVNVYAFITMMLFIVKNEVFI